MMLMTLGESLWSGDGLALVRLTVALLAIVDPLGNVPLFLSFTAGESVAGRRRTALVASFVTAIILICSVVFGQAILDFFSIRVASLQVGGGLLLLLIGLSMLHSRMSAARHTEEEQREAVDATNVAVVPLALPLMAGPGAISLVISESHRVSGWSDRLWLIWVVLVVCVLTWTVLRGAEVLNRRLRRTAIHVVTRLMGLILVAISVEMMATGLVALFPVLGSSSSLR